MRGEEVRQTFLNYFSEKGHTILPSSSLVPRHDPTLLFTNAGMVQFKDVFTGQAQRLYSRATSCQKCVRAGGKHNDLENVGYTARHHTFFEMLGNFSFGDYFKKEAIEMAWEFLTLRLGIPKEPLWVTVFYKDDEAAHFWNTAIGVASDRIVGMGEKDNFWSMGDTGPCGPCSEIILDQGPEFSCGKPDCRVGCDCDRYLEIWNLVFMQYERHENGKMTPLPKPSIDTGMGLERLTTVLQGGKSNYDSDLFTPILKAIEQETDLNYGRNSHSDISFRVIADHVRAITFLIGDGILPSNEGRGYVLRRIIRRAARHGKLIQINRPFLYKLVPKIAEVMNGPYPELEDNLHYISNITSQEEERFQYALERGLALLNEIIESSKTKKASQIPGQEIFRLYDTYGFPLDLTQEILAEQGLSYNQTEFDKAMARQREQARKHWLGSGSNEIKEIYKQLGSDLPQTRFLGYDTLSGTGQVLALITDSHMINSAKEGQEVEVIVDQTPFYAERGGQVGDSGIIKGEHFIADIEDTIAPADLFVHKAKIKRGSIKTGDQVCLEINKERRSAIALNHTATHLLHSALRDILGDHVRQAGSLVAPDRLRFDFTHFAPLTPKEKDRIEANVNEQIWKSILVVTQEMGLQNAIDSGAIALFGEKYQDQVRVVQISDISVELCGGTHSENTGEIGLFIILSETGIAAGVRRIEAITGKTAYHHIHNLRKEVSKISTMLKIPEMEIEDRVKRLMQELRNRERDMKDIKSKLAQAEIGKILNQVQVVEGINVLAYQPSGLNLGMEGLRDMADSMMDKLGSGVIILGIPIKNKANILIKISKDLTDRLKAPSLIKLVSEHIGGSGGGRPDMAQAGGNKPQGIDKALKSVPEVIRKFLQTNN